MAGLPASASIHAHMADAPTGWSITDTLLADIYAMWAGEQHPLRKPMATRAAAAQHHERAEQLLAHRERMEARAARLAEAANT